MLDFLQFSLNAAATPREMALQAWFASKSGDEIAFTKHSLSFHRKLWVQIFNFTFASSGDQLKFKT